MVFCWSTLAPLIKPSEKILLVTVSPHALPYRAAATVNPLIQPAGQVVLGTMRPPCSLREMSRLSFLRVGE